MLITVIHKSRGGSGRSVGEWEQADLHYVDHLLNADVLRACNLPLFREQWPVEKAPPRL